MASRDITYSFKAKDEGLTKMVGAIEKDMTRLSMAEKKVKDEFDTGKISAQKFGTELAKIDTSVQRNLRTLKKYGVEVKGLDNAFKFSGTKKGKGSAGASGGLALQEFGRGIADFNAAGGFTDFSRGALGATNNLERMVEIIGFTARKGGGLKKALGGIVGSLAGPAGIVFAITLALQFLPKLVEYFKQLSGNTEEADKAIMSLNDAILKQQGFKFDPLSEEYKKANEEITKLGTQIERLEGLKTGVRKTGPGAYGKIIYGITKEEQEQLDLLKGKRAELQGLIQDGKALFTDAQAKSDLEKAQLATYREYTSEMNHTLQLAKIEGATEEESNKQRLAALMILSKKNIGLERQKAVLREIEILEAKIANPKKEKQKIRRRHLIQVLGLQQMNLPSRSLLPTYRS